jgi:hypothetical protein
MCSQKGVLRGTGSLIIGSILEQNLRVKVKLWESSFVRSKGGKIKRILPP